MELQILRYLVTWDIEPQYGCSCSRSFQNKISQKQVMYLCLEFPAKSIGFDKNS